MLARTGESNGVPQCQPLCCHHLAQPLFCPLVSVALQAGQALDEQTVAQRPPES